MKCSSQGFHGNQSFALLLLIAGILAATFFKHSKKPVDIMKFLMSIMLQFLKKLFQYTHQGFYSFR
ncbi:MAG: hypothetical protein EHM28_12065 [Spirochaetaceae bacterium]|nr:MAG: hypothetical protein EHM28_12065 [Spirochaetaceae bacterium]